MDTDPHLAECISANDKNFCDTDRSTNTIGIVVLVTAVILLLIFLFVSAVHAHFGGDWSKTGQFGDTFGFLNPILSALTFGGILYTLFVQREELKLQREELRLQRQEAAASRLELQATAEAQRTIAEINTLIPLMEYRQRQADLLDASLENARRPIEEGSAGELLEMERNSARADIAGFRDRIEELMERARVSSDNAPPPERQLPENMFHL